jgi:hypothetical protein
MWLRALFSSALLLPVVGCVFFVPDYDPTSVCPITGSTPCAMCLRADCQQKVDACCGAKNCHSASLSGEAGSTMAAIDQCTQGNQNACASGLLDASRSPEGDDLATCVKSVCASVCVGAGGGTWTCATQRPDNDCASCIYDACASAVNTCCADATCPTDAAADMGSCTTGDTLNCGHAQSIFYKPAPQPAADNLRACIATKCRNRCFGADRIHTSCETNTVDTGCNCTDQATIDGSVCSSSVIAGATCYVTGVDSYFVGDAAGCTCGHYGCFSEGTDECRCEMGYTKDAPELTMPCNAAMIVPAKGQKAKPHCCLTRNTRELSCACGTVLPCGPDNSIVVDSCDPATIAQLLLPYKVDACSE